MLGVKKSKYRVFYANNVSPLMVGKAKELDLLAPIPCAAATLRPPASSMEEVMKFPVPTVVAKVGAGSVIQGVGRLDSGSAAVFA
jgi:hypothetical protein